MNSVITLITDAYAGAMKGVILSANPDTQSGGYQPSGPAAEYFYVAFVPSTAFPLFPSLHRPHGGS
jgi:hypothetical protein